MAEQPTVNAGVLSFRMGGKPMSVVGNMRIKVTGVEKEALDVATGPVGFKSKAVTPGVEFESIETSDATLEDFQNFNGNFTVTLRNRDSYSFTKGWVEGEIVLETEEHKVSLNFRALSGVKN